MKKDSVVIGYVHPGVVTEPFAVSLAKSCLHSGNKIIGIITGSSPRQHESRNIVIEKFLEGEGEWLMWVDTDQNFEPTAIQELRDRAGADNADMVAGLCFLIDRMRNVVTPNSYMWDSEENSFVETDNFVSGMVYEVDGTSSGFVLIHRRVFEAWEKPHWHENWFEHPASGVPMGHDLAFFWQATQVDGFKLIWDTTITSGHIKSFELNEEMFRANREMNK